MPDEMKTSQGTVFMGSDREIAFEDLSKTLSSKSGKGLWTRSLEEEYLERVQRRAAREAGALLAQAERERAVLLAEAEARVAGMLEEARGKIEAERHKADELNAAAAALHEEANSSYAEAREEGYNAGLAQAQADLDNFRSVMGESVGAVLNAVQEQCAQIFEFWKEDLCALVPLCVEKGLAWVLDEERAAVLENLLRESVRQLERNGSVTVRVHPEDEAAVADMFAAAVEHMRGFDGWTVLGDPQTAPGSLVLESAHQRVESRAEERKAAVDAVLRHLTLPLLPEEEAGRRQVSEAGARAAERMHGFAPRIGTTGGGSKVSEHEAPAAEELPPASAETEHAPDAQAACADAAGTATDLSSVPQSDTFTRDMPNPNAADPPEIVPEPAGIDAAEAGVPPAALSAAGAFTEIENGATDKVLTEGGFLPPPEKAR